MSPKVVAAVRSSLSALPPTSTVLLRRPRSSRVADYEQFVAVVAQTLGHTVEWCVPEPGGRAATFARDIQMAARSDAVIAMFDADHIMVGGTGHLVEKANEAGCSTFAYSIDEDGKLAYIGSQDPVGAGA